MRPKSEQESMTQANDLSAILISRICHDLVSPIGAIVNGVDLVREIGGGDVDAELAMISQSSNRASGLLQYYRIAFGAASEDSEVSRNALRDQAISFIGSPRIVVEWAADNGPHLKRPLSRLLYQMLMCARGLSGMRGVISVDLPADASLPLRISIESEGSPDSAEMLDILSGETEDVIPTPRLIEFVLARNSARALGLKLSVHRGDGRILMEVARVRAAMPA